MSDDPLQRLLDGPPLEATAFAANSRYHGLGTLQIPSPDGSVIVYLKRRFIAQPDRFTITGIHFVTQSDRLDNLSARYLGDPELFWRICDANAAMVPDDLTDTIGERVLITLPEGLV